MLPLTEVIYKAESAYLRYLGRKTNFVTAGKNELETAQYIWLHIIRHYNFEVQIEGLSELERDAFFHLLANFCSSEANQADYSTELQSVEQKIPWIFRRPHGGYFIPLEIIKKLMQEPLLKKHHFLFTLLYQLKLDELNSLATLAGQELEGQASISFESHVLDMALVLYIWYAGVLRNNFRRFVVGKVLASPFAEGDIKKKSANHLYISEPVPMWAHLKQCFGEEEKAIEKMKQLIGGGNKGFYRSLALLPDSTSRLYQTFKNVMLMPLLPTRVKKTVPLKVGAIKVVAPAEACTLIAKE